MTFTMYKALLILSKCNDFVKRKQNLLTWLFLEVDWNCDFLHDLMDIDWLWKKRLIQIDENFLCVMTWSFRLCVNQNIIKLLKNSIISLKRKTRLHFSFFKFNLNFKWRGGSSIFVPGRKKMKRGADAGRGLRILVHFYIWSAISTTSQSFALESLTSPTCSGLQSTGCLCWSQDIFTWRGVTDFIVFRCSENFIIWTRIGIGGEKSKVSTMIPGYFPCSKEETSAKAGNVEPICRDSLSMSNTASSFSSQSDSFLLNTDTMSIELDITGKKDA